ncbi:MAG: hypothetical protein HY822_17820 [Acidobacteria bacterium]|nr:hypothetical protein [Acidobacteriota bacterium]
MHQVVIDRWSRQASPLHRIEPRTKLVALAVFLVALATAPGAPLGRGAAYLLMIAAVIALARLPVFGLLARAAVVLPFSATFALVSLLAGDSQRAAALAIKSYLSASAVLLIVATTPLERLVRAMEALGAPRPVALIAQFLYRYLFVVSEQAQHMRVASLCRAPEASGAARRLRFRAAAGAVGVLFARSYARAEGIHRALMARGFEGRFPSVSLPRPQASDLAFLALAATLSVAIRWGVPG